MDLFVPGRLCLIGEHSDWAGLYKTINSEIVSGCAIV
ncbi:MAG: GHMP kinase, partial [Alphaproteobacteria bacterium]|nr:GHMP kinase [Alphaproteobacteria bacterium]